MKGRNTTIWLWIELVTQIEKEGSLELVWPYHKMQIASYLDFFEDVQYSSVRAATALWR